MDCPHIPEMSFGDFGRRLYEMNVARRTPLNGGIEVTSRCNLKCRHCYINLPQNDQEAKKEELTTKELCSIIDQIVDQGCLFLLFTGGEPFVRPDFLEIYTHAKKKGLLITLFTNGTTITPYVADYLAQWPPLSIEITLYGRTQETYETVTGVAGSHARCMYGIELLLERRLPLKLKSVISTLNKHELWEMKAYAEELGVSFRFDGVLNMRVDGGRNPEQLRMTPEDLVALDLMDEKRMKDFRDLHKRLPGPPAKPEYLYYCGAGQINFHIDAKGCLSLCLMSRVPAYDLRRGTFREGWHEFLLRARSQRRIKEIACQHCSLISICDQCPGWAQLEALNQEAQVEYLCRIAHLRAEALQLL